MGDANASIPTPQPLLMRPMFGAMGGAVGSTCLVFVSQAALLGKALDNYGLKKTPSAVRGCRQVQKKDMKLNDFLPKIKVDPETYEVFVDGEKLTCGPAERLPLAQRYFLF
jgi:urease alpha subunit